MRYFLRRGESHQLTPTVLAEAELGFSTDTKELMIGTKSGPVKVSDVVEGPDGILYAPVPEGMIPLCIKAF